MASLIYGLYYMQIVYDLCIKFMKFMLMYSALFQFYDASVSNVDFCSLITIDHHEFNLFLGSDAVDNDCRSKVFICVSYLTH